MTKSKSHGKDRKKGSQLVIRVEKAERDAFVSLCDRLDTSAAREIRRFMRDRVAVHSSEKAASSDGEMLPAAEAVADTAGRGEASQPADLVAADTLPGDAAADETAKPKKKQKRAAA